MDISEAKRAIWRRSARKRVGRGIGSGHGKTSTRGNNGARSRSGWSGRGLTGGSSMWQRLPKRGFSNQPFKARYDVVNVGQLNRFPAGTVITRELLQEAGILAGQPGDGLKVLGDGELTRPVTVRAHACSASARSKILSAGGTVEIIPPPKPPVRNKARPRRPPAEAGLAR